ncbi:MAG: polyprenol monophosphomannose synthase [Prevotellaceae bacterium]|jgi:dolichol-phosphate mannosyltransferase|nr:polyprenol monophosphomannose synthase [Prevotellaceae bacterium]
MTDTLVIIPMYNERENAERILRKVFSLDGGYHILVIDDRSPDGTAAIVKQLQGEFPQQLHLIERAGKLGLGTAYIAGFHWALERGYEYIIEMDADFSHNPDDLPRLRSACAHGADVVIGSRYSNGVSVVNWPLGRVLMSYCASQYVRLATGMRVHDTTAGFVCYRRRALQRIPLQRIRMKGYGFQIEMKYLAYKLGFTIKEIPIIFIDRKEGSSKMSGGIFNEAFTGVLKLRFRRLK